MEKDLITLEPAVMNLFDEPMDLVEEEPMIEDPDIPDVEIRPPDIRKKYVEPEPQMMETPVRELPQTLGPRNEAVDSFFREETVAVHKHKALETLKKYRKEKPLDLKQSMESPIKSDKLAPMRKCESCYFCVDNKRVGGSSWCHCTNVGRSTDTAIVVAWVRSRLNAPCWRRPETL